MTASIRRFNRYYARVLGIFNNRYLDADYTPTQVRVIGEIGRNPGVTAKEIAACLFLDKSYLSRVIRRLCDDGLILRGRAGSDGRMAPLRLSPEGEKLHAELDRRADMRIQGQIDALTDDEKRQLVDAMERIRSIMSRAIPDAEQR